MARPGAAKPRRSDGRHLELIPQTTTLNSLKARRGPSSLPTFAPFSPSHALPSRSCPAASLTMSFKGFQKSLTRVRLRRRRRRRCVCPSPELVQPLRAIVILAPPAGGETRPRAKTRQCNQCKSFANPPSLFFSAHVGTATVQAKIQHRRADQGRRLHRRRAPLPRARDGDQEAPR